MCYGLEWSFWKWGSLLSRSLLWQGLAVWILQYNLVSMNISIVNNLFFLKVFMFSKNSFLSKITISIVNDLGLVDIFRLTKARLKSLTDYSCDWYFRLLKTSLPKVDEININQKTNRKFNQPLTSSIIWSISWKPRRFNKTIKFSESKFAFCNINEFLMLEIICTNTKNKVDWFEKYQIHLWNFGKGLWGISVSRCHM